MKKFSKTLLNGFALAAVVYFLSFAHVEIFSRICERLRAKTTDSRIVMFSVVMFLINTLIFMLILTRPVLHMMKKTDLTFGAVLAAGIIMFIGYLIYERPFLYFLVNASKYTGISLKTPMARPLAALLISAQNTAVIYVTSLLSVKPVSQSDDEGEKEGQKEYQKE